MNRSQIDWRGGEVRFWDMDGIDLDVHLRRQAEWELKEDLAQVAYGEEVVLDVGWYPSFSEDGEFRIRVVAERDWEEPLFEETTATATGLVQTLERAVSVATAAARQSARS